MGELLACIWTSQAATLLQRCTSGRTVFQSRPTRSLARIGGNRQRESSGTVCFNEGRERGINLRASTPKAITVEVELRSGLSALSKLAGDGQVSMGNTVMKGRVCDNCIQT